MPAPDLLFFCRREDSVHREDAGIGGGEMADWDSTLVGRVPLPGQTLLADARLETFEMDYDDRLTI